MGLIIKNGIKYVGDNSVELTQAQYDALPQAEKLNGTTYYITDGQNITTASAVTYDNTASGMTATDVQAAIDEVNGKGIGDIDDVNLSSPAKGDVLAFDGTNWVNFDLGALESASTASANPITCANSIYTECVHLTLDKGLYLVIGMLGFSTNATGVRGINISLNSGDAGNASSRLYMNACSGVQTRCQTVFLIRVENNPTTYYLNAYQTSGAALNVIYSILTAIKIGI